MKTVKIMILNIAVLCFGMVTVNAQKFGHFNSLEILSMMPEVTSAQKDIETYGKQLESQLVTMQQEYQTKYKQYLTDEEQQKITDDATRQARQKDILDLETRIGQFQMSAQEKILARESDKMKPIEEKIFNAINVIGANNGYTYIFDTSKGAILYMDNNNDVTSLLKSQLGL